MGSHKNEDDWVKGDEEATGVGSRGEKEGEVPRWGTNENISKGGRKLSGGWQRLRGVAATEAKKMREGGKQKEYNE